MGIFKIRIRQFTRTYSKTEAKTSREKKLYLENKLKILEKNSNLQNDKTEYDICKQELNTIYDEVSTIIKIRSRCDNEFCFKLRKTPCFTKYS